MLRKLLGRWTVFLVIFGLAACGSKPEIQEIKDYRFYLGDLAPSLSNAVAVLISDFNRSAGIVDALKIVVSPTEATCEVVMTKGLRHRDGKVGWGQWIAKTTETEGSKIPPTQTTRETRYSMRLEFDEDFFNERIAGTDAKAKTDMEKLFFHEVGHGLQMDHSTDPSDIMYFDINGTKDFSAYFARAQAYLAE